MTTNYKPMQPLNQNVVLRTFEDEETVDGIKTGSGFYPKIIMPNNWNKNRVVKCEILAVGGNVQELNIGDVVLSQNLGGIPLSEDTRLVHEDIILAKVE